LVLELLGLVSFYAFGGSSYLLLVIAVVGLAMRLIQAGHR
jgi:hypothetical protein